MIDFRVLGPVTVSLAGQPIDLPTAMQRRLLAILLCRPGAAISIDQLIDAMWQDDAPATARKTLQIYVHRLRRAGLHDRILRDSSGYTLSVLSDEVDSSIFREKARLASDARHNGNLLLASQTYRRALGLWRGEPFADVSECMFVDGHANQLRELRLGTTECFADVELALGNHHDLVGALVASCAAFPYAERLRGQLMLAMYRSGRLADALGEFRSIHRTLIDDLGVEPGPEIRQLHDQLLRDEISPFVPERQTVESAWRPGPPTLLPPMVRGFAARVDELRFLTDLLPAPDTDDPTVVVAISGAPGIGKTSLAVRWAHSMTAHFPDGQLYVNLRGFDSGGPPLEPSEALRTFLIALGAVPSQIPADACAQTAMFRNMVARRRILVLLDNARDAEQIRPLLPGSPTCMVVVTSRNQMRGLAVTDGAHALTLDLFSVQDARLMIGSRIGHERLAEVPQASEEIISACARLPLALAVAAAQMTFHSGRPLDELADELRHARSTLDFFASHDRATDVRGVLSWSYMALTPSQARLFRIASTHPGQDFDTPTLAAMGGVLVDEAAATAAFLAESCMLTRTGRDRYEMHDLLRNYGKELTASIESEAQRKQTYLVLIDHYLRWACVAAKTLYPQLLPIPMPDARDGSVVPVMPSADAAYHWLSSEFDALTSCVSTAAAMGLDGHAWRIAWAISDFATRQCRWNELRETQSVALAAAERGSEPTGVGHSLRRLASAELLRDRSYAEGVHLLNRALEVFTQLDSPAEQGLIHGELIACHLHFGNHEQALSHARLADAQYRRAGHEGGQALALNAIGCVQTDLGRPEEGLPLAQSALKTLLRLGDNYGAAATWDTVGRAHRLLGNVSDAIASYESSVALYRVVDRRDYVADGLMRLGHSYSAAGRVRDAAASWQEADDIRRGLGIESASDNLGLLLAGLGESAGDD